MAGVRREEADAVPKTGEGPQSAGAVSMHCRDDVVVAGEGEVLIIHCQMGEYDFGSIGGPAREAGQTVIRQLVRTKRASQLSGLPAERTQAGSWHGSGSRVRTAVFLCPHFEAVSVPRRSALSQKTLADGAESGGGRPGYQRGG